MSLIEQMNRMGLKFEAGHPVGIETAKMIDILIPDGYLLCYKHNREVFEKSLDSLPLAQSVKNDIKAFIPAPKAVTVILMTLGSVFDFDPDQLAILTMSYAILKDWKSLAPRPFQIMTDDDDEKKAFLAKRVVNFIFAPSENASETFKVGDITMSILGNSLQIERAS